MRKESQALQLLIGCFSIIGAIFTILGFIVAVLMIFHQQPIYVFLESVLPTPTAVAGVVSGTPRATTPLPTTTQVLTTATLEDQQSPLPGQVVPAGQPISKGGVTVTLLKKILTESWQFGFYFVIENSTSEQILIRYKPSSIKVTDSRGTQYYPGELLGVGVQPDTREKALDWIKQFTIEPRQTATLEPSRWYWHDTPTRIPLFQGGIDPDAKFLIITIDKLAGMENLMWRYDLP